MKRIFSVLLGIALLGPAAVAAPMLRQQILGTWRLVSFERKESASAPWTHYYGDHPAGYLMYDGTGHMMVTLATTPPTPKFASGDGWTPTAAEAQAAYRGFTAYFGTYTVDEAAHAVTHHVEGSLNPSFTGTDQVRPAALAGDRLTLTDGKTYRVMWERVR
ncbi:MAG TPA: lipocalin-like domain-containing protein [Thermoanaerobaculia bacterium]